MYIVQKHIDIKTWGIKKIEKSENGGYYNSLGKEKARNYILKAAMKYGSILELGYGLDGKFHKMVTEKAPEVKIKTTDHGGAFKNKNQLKKIAKTNPNLIVEEFKKWSKKGLETFGVLWLDYCGPWTDRIAKDVKIATRVMQGKGEIYFTLLKAREHVSQLGLKIGASREKIDAAIELSIEKAFKDARLKVTKIKEIQYKSSPGGTMKTFPMKVVGYRYTKM